MKWLKARWKRLWTFLYRWWGGKLLNIELADTASPARSEAEEAVARVVFETNVAPDCVAATVIRGGPAILIKHDKAQEAFVHHTYAKAADKAIEWLKHRESMGRELKQGMTSGLNRAQRRQFESRRRREKKGRKFDA